MDDFKKNYIQNHGQEIEVRNETVAKDNDRNDIFGNYSLGDIIKNIEKELFSDDPFPAFSNLPSILPSSSSALHWPYQPNQFHESNMHPNPNALQLRPNNPVQEPNLFDDLNLLVPENGFNDFFPLPDDCVVNRQNPDIPQIIQPSKLIEGNASGNANANSNLAIPSPTSAPNPHDPDLSRMFLDWLKFNRDSISREDLRTIKLKNSTIENAFAQLGNNKEGKKKLVQLVLTWVQEHKLREKKHPQVEIPIYHNPYSKDYQLPHMCVNNQTVANPNFAPITPFSVDTCLPNVNSPMQENAGMAGSSSATEEARKRRMERKRRLYALHRHQTKDNKTNVIKPISETRIGSSHRFCKYADKLHNLRRNWQRQNNVNPDLANMTPIVNVRNSITTFMEKRKARSLDLKFLFQKVLMQSDVGSLGRIVLPKKEAEKHLPMLEERGRIQIQMEDIYFFCAWEFWYRFWPNNKSRMYVLENTGGFVQSNKLQEGDIVAIYLNLKNNKYWIKGTKVRRPNLQKEAMEKCQDQTMQKDHQKINSDPNTFEKKDKTVIEDDNYIVEIPSDSDED